MVKKKTAADIKKTNKTEMSLQRLEDAVACMENAAKAQSKENGSGEPSKELEGLRKNNTDLKKANDAVAKRLDGTINQLKTILG